MENIIDFSKFKQEQSLNPISSFDEATYDNLRESVRVWRSTMKEEGLLSYVKSITSLKTKEYLFVIAATFGLEKLVSYFIGEGINLNTRNPAGLTALMNASARYLNTVKVLVEAGAEIDFHDNMGNTSLQYAAWSLNIEVIKYLLSKGAKPNIACLGGILNSTLLFLVNDEREEKSLPIIELLLQNGADLEEKSQIGNTPLITAICLDLRKVIELFLKYNVNTELVDVNGYTALMWAVQKGNVSLTKLLLVGGCNINAQGGYKVTPLMLAIDNKNSDITNLLIEKGAKLEIEDSLEHTAIVHAVKTGDIKFIKLLIEKGAQYKLTKVNLLKEYLAYYVFHYLDYPLRKLDTIPPVNIELVEYLLKKGVDPNLHREFENTPLIEAAKIGDINLVELLLKYGANPNIHIYNHGLAISNAALYGHNHIVERLYNCTNLDNLNDKSKLFHYAIWGNSLELIEFLLNKDFDINSQGEYGYSVLMTAAGRGYVNIMRFLLAKGADPSVRSGVKNTLLMEAVKSGNLEAIKIVLELKVDINEKGYNDETALIIAAREGYSDVMEFLIENGANVNACGSNGTALIEAAKKGHKDVIKVLINKGADINIGDYYGYTAITHATFNQNNEIISLLKDVTPIEEFKKQEGLAIILAADKEDIDLTKKLIAKNANPNIQNKRGNTALIKAVGRLNTSIIKVLIENGANLNIKGEYGHTAIDSVRSYKEGDAIEIIALLLKHGADINYHGNILGYTLLVSCCKNIKLVKYLLGKGANPNIRDKDNETLFIKAVKSNDIELIKLLLNYSEHNSWDKHQEYDALCEAVRANNQILIELLLKRVDIIVI